MNAARKKRLESYQNCTIDSQEIKLHVISDNWNENNYNFLIKKDLKNGKKIDSRSNKGTKVMFLNLITDNVL